MWTKSRPRINVRPSPRADKAGRPPECEPMEPRTLLSVSLVTVTTAGNVAAGGGGINLSGAPTSDFSPDGRFVLFTDNTPNLVAGVTDTNNADDVFVRDLQTGTTSMVSVDAAGNALGGSGNNLRNFVFSPDSHFLVFQTQSPNMVAGVADTNNARDVFVRDLLSGVTSVVSINAAGTSTGNSTSDSNNPPVFSPDGKFLAFYSIAGDLVSGVTDTGGRDLFLRNMQTGATSVVSINAGGTAAVGNVDDEPILFTADSRYIVFSTESAGLDPTVTDSPNANDDLFARDLQTGTTSLVSRSFDNQAVGFVANTPKISPDGKLMLYYTGATNVVAGVTDANGSADLFIWNFAAHANSLVTATPDGTATGTSATSIGSIATGFSPDSRYVAFGSASTNLTPQSAVGSDSKADLYVRDLLTNTTRYVATNDSSSVAFDITRFSPDGVHLLFQQETTDPVGGTTDTNNEPDLFLYDLQTSAITLVTVNTAGTGTGNKGVEDGSTFGPEDLAFSPDGRYLTFVSEASNLAPGTPNNFTANLFVRDLQAGVTSLAAFDINGMAAGYDRGGTHDAVFDPSGRYLLYMNSGLIDVPVNHDVLNFTFARNLYAYDVVTKANSLLSINSAGTADANGDVEPFTLVVNPAGGSVLFASAASNMIAGVTDLPPNSPAAAALDVFIATLPNATGNPGGPGAGSPAAAVSGNGAAIADNDPTPDSGDGTDFGSTSVGAPVTRTFTVANSGTAALTTSGLTLPAGFSVAEPLDASIAAGSSDTFTVQFDAATAGAAGGNVTFATNDPAANPFAFAVTATAFAAPTNGPDLVIEGGVTGVKAGNFIGGSKGGAASVNVVNRGNAAAAGNVQVTFYASTDMTLDANDTPIVTASKAANLKVGKGAKISAKFNYPASVADGQYFILAKADPANAIVETDETNNVASSPLAVGIAAPFVDLSGTALVPKGAFKSGKTGSASLSLHNAGNTTAAGVATIQLIASTDAVLGNGDDVLLGSIPTKVSLKPGATKAVTLKGSLAGLAPASYTLIAVIDSGNAIAESDEANNTVFSTVQISVT